MNQKSESGILVILAVLLLVCIIAAVTVFVMFSGHPKSSYGLYFEVNGKQAVEIVAQDPAAQQYLSENFKRPEWRVVKSTLIQDSLYTINGSLIQQEQPYWKVEMMERTCSCGTVKDLFVVEGYVSTDTGELFNLTIGQVKESQYDKKTCASTVCH
ncbi:MAG: hypothetical protein P1P80_02860 [ANME-2 cluster archaeon]|nr:hypothetical protein [ANME-2 cluster archaeon]